MLQISNAKEGSNARGYIDFAKRFHKNMAERNFSLVYEGEVTQEITKAFASLAQKSLENADEDRNVRKKVFHVMVECLQNITKHTGDNTLEEGITGSGIFIIGTHQDEYIITTGNTIKNENVSSLKNMLENINKLDKDGVKELYKEKLKESRLSAKGGAGLGFIDIAKKTGEKLEFYFVPVDDANSFFILRTKIAKIKA